MDDDQRTDQIDDMIDDMIDDVDRAHDQLDSIEIPREAGNHTYRLAERVAYLIGMYEADLSLHHPTDEQKGTTE